MGVGFVASLAKPGENITGFTGQQDEALGKLVGILHEVTPSARRIAILVNETNPLHAAFWAGAQSACAALDLVALRVAASTPAQLGTAVEQIVRQRSQAIVVTSDTLYFAERTKLQEFRPPGCRSRMRCATTWSRAGCSAMGMTSPRPTATRRSTWTRS